MTGGNEDEPPPSEIDWFSRRAEVESSLTSFGLFQSNKMEHHLFGEGMDPFA